MFPGETISSGAPDVCSDCKIHLVNRVLKSNAGFYIGTACQCGPYSRESGYYYSQWEAEVALGKFSTFGAAIAEIQGELIMARKAKHLFIPKRIEFLEKCLASMQAGKVPTLAWNYALAARPENAYEERQPGTWEPRT